VPQTEEHSGAGFVTRLPAPRRRILPRSPPALELRRSASGRGRRAGQGGPPAPGAGRAAGGSRHHPARRSLRLPQPRSRSSSRSLPDAGHGRRRRPAGAGHRRPRTGAALRRLRRGRHHRRRAAQDRHRDAGRHRPLPRAPPPARGLRPAIERARSRLCRRRPPRHHRRHRHESLCRSRNRAPPRPRSHHHRPHLLEAGEASARAGHSQSQPARLPLPGKIPLRRGHRAQAGAGRAGAPRPRAPAKDSAQLSEDGRHRHHRRRRAAQGRKPRHRRSRPARAAPSRRRWPARPLCRRGPRSRRPAITGFDVAFRLAPRINAAGRMDVASEVIELFTTRDPPAPPNWPPSWSASTASAARPKPPPSPPSKPASPPMPELAADRLLLVDGDGWHRGVIGILASRVVERTAKPAIVVSVEDGVAHGSGRSVDGFHAAQRHRELRRSLHPLRRPRLRRRLCPARRPRCRS
jgi:hypothetical protein